MAAGPALAIAGAVIGRTAHLALAPNWFASACLFHANLALPGDGKSPCLDYMMKPVTRIERELAEEFREEREEYTEELEEFNRQKKENKSSGGPAVGEESEAPKPQVPVRLFIDDSTTEAYLRTLAGNERGLLLCNDELAVLLLGMNQYKGKGGNDLPILLKVWSGKHIVIDRVKHEFGEPTHIYSPHMGITGNLPPAMLAAMVSKRGDLGFLDRWLFVYPNRRPKLKSGERGHVSDETIGQWNSLVRNLWARTMDKVDAQAIPYVVQFTDEGKVEYDRLYDLHVDELNSADFPISLRGPWSKLEEYAGRFCLILALMHGGADQASDSPDRIEVGPSIVRGAWRLVEYFKSQHRRVRAALEGKGVIGVPDGARLILNWINNHPEVESFPQSELTRTYPPSRYDRATMEDGLSWLVKKTPSAEPLCPNGLQGHPVRSRPLSGRFTPTSVAHPEIQENQENSGLRSPSACILGNSSDPPDSPDNNDNDAPPQVHRP